MEKGTKYLDGRGWTAEQSKELKEKYPSTFNKDLVKIFNKSNRSIVEKAKRLGIKKDRELLASHRRTLRLGSTSHRKGVSMNCEYGIEKALKIKKKMSESNIGKPSPVKGIKNPKISAALKGRKFTEVWKKNLSEKKKEQFKNGQLNNCIGAIGEKNSSWQGGVSFEPYDINFNNKFKRAIRKRDNQICMLCNIHREKLSRALNVHHIDYNKLLSIPQNCISLCDSCHSKTNSNRNHWKTFFQNILSEKYNYKYENKEVIVEIAPAGERSGMF